MAKNKTTETASSVSAFVNSVADQQQRQDSLKLIELMKKVSGHEPKMWGPSIIGFGSYHYKYDSGREGDAPLLAFSPRKAALSLYACAGPGTEASLKDLGKFKASKGCLYIKKLSDVNEPKLLLLMKQSMQTLQSRYGTQKGL